MRRERGIRVLDNYCWQVIAPLQTRLCSDNVPIKTAVEKGGRSSMVMQKNDNYKSIVGCVTVNVLTRKRGSNLTCGSASVFVQKSIPHHLYLHAKRDCLTNLSGSLFLKCGANGNRTSDTRIFSPLLYQLSYGTLMLLLSIPKRVIGEKRCKSTAFF